MFKNERGGGGQRPFEQCEKKTDDLALWGVPKFNQITSQTLTRSDPDVASNFGANT